MAPTAQISTGSATAPHRTARSVAVVGSGMAGAACARALADAGFDVGLFDKSRGVGGRMATRRAAGLGDDGRACEWRFDHGAPGFSARAPGFVHAVTQASGDGLLARWVPRLAPGGHVPLDDPALWVPVPDMPAWCRALLGGLPVQTGCLVDTLRRDDAGWRLLSAGATVGEGFDAVVVAIPPFQAAPLLQPHRADWARQALALTMHPGWALMAVTGDAQPAPDWDLAWPTSGPLACIVRNDAKPGRTRRAGLAQWVAHATPEWSRTHLEAPADEVLAALKDALAAWLGRPPTWLHADVHRWRYASAPRGPSSAVQCWWDAGAGLGVCGDALGGAGVEGAWCSGRALAGAITDHASGSQARDAVAPSRLRHP